VYSRAFSRRDTKHGKILRTLERLGISTMDTSPLGENCPDAVLGFQGRNYLLEIKTLTGKRNPKMKKCTKGQNEFHLLWRGSPVIVAATVEEILPQIGWTAPEYTKNATALFDEVKLNKITALKNGNRLLAYWANNQGKNMSEYIEILKPVVNLPGFMDCSMVEFAHAIRVCIETERHKPNPDEVVIATLCNAARVGWELIRINELAHLPRLS
jgi:hypothetical protein